MKTLCVKIPEEIYAKLKAKATARGETVSDLVRDSIIQAQFWHMPPRLKLFLSKIGKDQGADFIDLRHIFLKIKDYYDAQPFADVPEDCFGNIEVPSSSDSLRITLAKAELVDKYRAWLVAQKKEGLISYESYTLRLGIMADFAHDLFNSTHE